MGRTAAQQRSSPLYMRVLRLLKYDLITFGEKMDLVKYGVRCSKKAYRNN